MACRGMISKAGRFYELIRFLDFIQRRAGRRASGTIKGSARCMKALMS